KRATQCSMESTNDIVRITRLTEIRDESRSHCPCFIFRRRVASQCDHGSEASVFRIAFPDGFKQLVAIRITEAYICDDGMCRTSAKRLNSAVDRLCHDNRRARLLQHGA